MPAGLDVRDASIVELAAVSWHALRLADTGPGKRVAVGGGGALRLLAAAGALRQGDEDVAIEARHPHQLEAAEQLGARTKPEGLYDAVEAAGTPQSLARSIERVAPGDIARATIAHRLEPPPRRSASPPTAHPVRSES